MVKWNNEWFAGQPHSKETRAAFKDTRQYSLSDNLPRLKPSRVTAPAPGPVIEHSDEVPWDE